MLYQDKRRVMQITDPQGSRNFKSKWALLGIGTPVVAGTLGNREMLHGEIIQISDGPTKIVVNHRLPSLTSNRKLSLTRRNQRGNLSGKTETMMGKTTGIITGDKETNHTGRNRNQNNQMVSYVPSHQKWYQGNNSNAQSQQQGNQGLHGNFYHGQGSSSNNQQGASSSQQSAKQPKSAEEPIGDLLNSQQHIQGKMLANNDVVHKLQDAQQEHKVVVDMLTKQLSQMATTLNEIRCHNGHLPATVEMPNRANISKITLRSGKDYAKPVQREGGEMANRKAEAEDPLRKMKESLPQFAESLLPDEEPEELHEEK